MLSSPSTILAWVGLFVATHLGLSLTRAPIVARIGSVKFTLLYSLVAWGTFGGVVFAYATQADPGPPGLGLAGTPGVAEGSAVAMGLGVVLMTSIIGPTGYVRSAAVVFGTHTRAPRGMERITRHPFFVGLAVFCAGHILVAPRMSGVVLFGGLLLLAVVGGPLLDRKLRARRGQAHVDYLAATSIVPFVAILRGRQRLVLGELPWVFIALGGAAVWGARALHGTGHGPWLVMVAMVVGPSYFALVSALRHHRARSS